MFSNYHKVKQDKNIINFKDMEDKLTILEWLKKKPLITIYRVEKSAGIPTTLLHQALKGVANLPDKYVPVLSKILKEYGFLLPKKDFKKKAIKKKVLNKTS